jgi:hypothetical protein
MVMLREPTIEKKGYADPRAKKVLLDALRGRGGKLTRSDAMTISGLPDDETGRALTVLLKEYRSHLSTTDSGELLYEFDPAFARRDAVKWRDAAAALAGRLWKGFTFLFKIAIVTTLVVYFVAFVAMFLAFVLIRRGDSDGDDDGIGIWPLLWMWGWNGGPEHQRQRLGRAGRPPRKAFYKSVFEFVFGPPATAVDPLADEKEILSAIRARAGRIAPVDLVRLWGWDFPRAEEEATRLLADYGGEPEVTEDGVVIYVFKDLRKTAGALTPSSPVPAVWERVEHRQPLSGNAPGTDVLIGAFNGFNLLAPLWIVPLFEAKFGVSTAGWEFFVRDFPLAFSALFFAVPFGRWVKSKLEARQQAARNTRRELLRRIFGSGGRALERQELAPTPALGAVLDQDLVRLGGDVETDDEGRVRYVFPRIRQETTAVAHSRSTASARELDPGAIVFSSAD